MVGQIMDSSRQSITNYLNDEKTHAAIKNRLFQNLAHINDQLYKTEIVKSGIEHKEPIFVDFFPLQYCSMIICEICSTNISFFDEILGYKRIRRIGNVYRLSLLSTRRERFLWAVSEKKQGKSKNC